MPPDAERRLRIAAQTMLFAEGARALAALAGVGPVLVIKGAATSPLVWAPGERAMTDIDLLVAPDRLADARIAMAAAGFQLLTTSHRPLGSRWHRAFTAKSVRGALIDVHAHIAQSVRWPVPFASLAARAEPFALARTHALRPCLEDAMLIAALNEAKDEYAQGGQGLEDIARMARLPVDWPALVHGAKQWRATVALWLALERACVRFAAPVPLAVRSALRPRRALVLGALRLDARGHTGTRQPVRPGARRLRQAIVGPLLTDSPARFIASAAGFAVVRAVDAVIHRVWGEGS